MRLTTGLLLLGIAATSSAAAQPAPAPVSLITVPTKVYFSPSNAKEQQAGSIFFLIVETDGDGVVEPLSLELTYRKAGAVVRTDRLLSPLLQAIDITQLQPSRLYSPTDAANRRWPHAFRLFLSLPASVEADSVEARLTATAGGHPVESSATIPIAAYQQNTSLVFPFRGPGIVNVAGVLASGHRNRSGLYAIDVLGLNPTYGPMLGSVEDDRPANYAGFGREIIAPAAGKVVVARNDHVDQPVAGTSDPAYFLPEYRNGGDPGNLVVIDHGNGEFSMIGHMKLGSVRVKVGDRVSQGQVIGLMGNSGDTSGPHVHYQLQNGPDWERSDALPFKFTNVRSLTPGSYFDAK